MVVEIKEERDSGLAIEAKDGEHSWRIKAD